MHMTGRRNLNWLRRGPLGSRHFSVELAIHISYSKEMFGS
jgi:hypothetical protein